MKYPSVSSIYLLIYSTLQLVCASRASGTLVRGTRSKYLASNLSRSYRNNAVCDTISLIERHGYPVEEHEVTTEDGYILRIFRIPATNSSNSSENRVVLLQHGFMASSEVFVLLGPNQGLSFTLADAGYDVWIGNVRGNTYGKRHKFLKTTSSEFWNFSYHEMATRDLPAVIDYILDQTNQKALYFIGHSMGGMIPLIMLSSRPEYNEKITLLVSLGPSSFWKNLNPLQTVTREIIYVFLKFLKIYNVHEIFAQNSLPLVISSILCQENSIFHSICLEIAFGLFGEDREQFSGSLIPVVFSSFPAGTSEKTLFHYYQNLRSGTFREFDFERDENLVRYSQPEPPDYQLQNVAAPVALIYGSGDALITLEELKELAGRLKNLIMFETVPYTKFNHMDFIVARDVRNLLNERIVEILKQN